MRPLSVEVLVKEEEEEDSCVVKLPDGTVHTQAVRVPSTGQLSQLTETQSPSHARLPLPTITEQGAAPGATQNDFKVNNSITKINPRIVHKGGKTKIIE